MFVHPHLREPRQTSHYRVAECRADLAHGLIDAQDDDESMQLKARQPGQRDVYHAKVELWKHQGAKVSTI